MFERYTERARRVIFFARYEASQFGSMTIETPHLLLGLIREDKNLTNRFLQSSPLVDIRREITSRIAIREKISTSLDLPLSSECKHILAYANEEAGNLAHRHIGTEHLLLGILRERSCLAALLLVERGLSLESIREELARSGPSNEAPLLARDSRGLTLRLSSDALEQLLDKHRFSAPKDHLFKAIDAKDADNLKEARAELKLFLDGLIDAIRDQSSNSELLSPVFEGFDWRKSVQALRSGLPDEDDWKFRLWFTLLLAELLMDRFLASRS